MCRIITILAWVGMCWASLNAAAQDAKPAAASTMIRYWDPMDYINKGGIFIWAIILCSVIATTLCLERLISLRRGRVIPASLIHRFEKLLQAGQLDQKTAIEQCHKNQSILANILLAVCRRWGKPLTEIEKTIADTGAREVVLLRRNLRALNSVANIAMLLGLLGTVTGMIKMYNSLTVAKVNDRTEVLATGIAEALLTTALGLVVAIPALAAFSFFSGKVERLVYEMDVLCNEFAHEICSETLSETSRRQEILKPRDPPRSAASKK